MGKVVLISGGDGTFGALTAQTLAAAGEIVYAGACDIPTPRHERTSAVMPDHGRSQLRALDLRSRTASAVRGEVDRAVAATGGQLDVLVHDLGDAGALADPPTPGQLAELFRVRTHCAHLLNRAAARHLPRQGGLVVWIMNAGSGTETLSYLGPYFAALDAFVHSCADVHAAAGVQTCVVVAAPNPFSRCGFGSPPGSVAALLSARSERHRGPLGSVDRLATVGLDPTVVAQEVARIVTLPAEQRPPLSIVDQSEGAWWPANGFPAHRLSGVSTKTTGSSQRSSSDIRYRW